MIDEVLRGSDSARSQLFKWFWPPAILMVRRFLAHDQAEDVAVNAIIRVFGPLPPGRRPSIVHYDRTKDFLPWFLQAMTHQAIDFLRSEATRRAREVEAGTAYAERARETLCDPAVAAMAAEEKQRVAEVRARYFSPEQNALLELWQQKETYADMARAMGRPIGTVARQIHDMVQRLKEHFDDQP